MNSFIFAIFLLIAVSGALYLWAMREMSQALGRLEAVHQQARKDLYELQMSADREENERALQRQ